MTSQQSAFCLQYADRLETTTLLRKMFIAIRPRAGLFLLLSSNWVGVRDNAGMRPLVISTTDPAYVSRQAAAGERLRRSSSSCAKCQRQANKAAVFAPTA